MMTGNRGRVRGADGEGGSALIIVLMMIAMLGVLTLTLATLSVNNLTGARRAQQAGVALNSADAGLAQAVEYLRSAGVGALTCSPTCTETESRWTDSSNPTTVTIPGGEAASYRVWIETTSNPDVYRVHSSGVAGSSAVRAVTQDVTVAPQKYPMGIFANSIGGGGNAGVHSQSMFTTGCVYKRSHITFSGPDLLNNLPRASMHSSQIITEDNGSAVYCSTTKNKDIHDDGKYCNMAFTYDQDKLGGPLAGTPCAGSGVKGETSKIDDDKDLFETFNFKSPPLTDAELDRLKTVAMSQGNYYTAPSGWTDPDDANAVMYFDLLKTGGEVNLRTITGYDRAPGLAAGALGCGPRSLTIIVNGGNVRANANQKLEASLFVLGEGANGKVFFNGGLQFIGTLYANKIDLGGNADLHMDECFKANTSPALFVAETRNYREVDR
jgi:type II secretory pathway pseudopilin PulG